MSPKVIAFYLPQYHPTPHNDEWWGEGFTEWTNVAKAKPLFPGHYQPKIPADLGFYDLRMPEVRQKQVELAKEAGISGFCYYHYWFGDEHEELEFPFNEVLRLGEPDFPFCLCWANESWHKKFWNKDGSMGEGSKMLAEQKYLGEEDDIHHFQKLLPAFKDRRYFRIDDKPVFVIYRPLGFVEMKRFITLWNKLAIDNGLKGVYFIGYSIDVVSEKERLFNIGFDAIDSCRLSRNTIHDFGWAIRKSISMILRTPRRVSYKKVMHTFIGEEEKQDNIFPTLLPNWDHTPRSGVNGDLYTNCSPVLFEKHCLEVFDTIKDKPADRQIVFLKSWNEWGEGNYMEPDLKFGKGYIKALKNALSNYILWRD